MPQDGKRTGSQESRLLKDKFYPVSAEFYKRHNHLGKSQIGLLDL